MTAREIKISKRREKKIFKIYRTPDWRENPRLMNRLRCLEQAEANDMEKRAKPPFDMAQFDADLKHARELLAKYGDSAS